MEREEKDLIQYLNMKREESAQISSYKGNATFTKF